MYKYTRKDIDNFLNTSVTALGKYDFLSDYKIGVFREGGYNVAIYRNGDLISQYHTKTAKNTCFFICRLNNLIFSEIVKLNNPDDLVKLFYILKD